MSAGRLSAVAVFGLTLALGAQAQESAGCAASLDALRALLGDAALARRWSEVSMDDNMPLLLSTSAAHKAASAVISCSRDSFKFAMLEPSNLKNAVAHCVYNGDGSH